MSLVTSVAQVHGHFACEGTHVYPITTQVTVHNLKILRGDTFELNLQVFQSDGVTPQDLTGAVVRSTIKQQLEDLDIVAVSQVSSIPSSKPVGGAASLTDAVNGKVNVRHAPAATVGLPVACKALYYDVQVTLADGRVWTIDWGTIIVQADVTLTS